LFFKKTSMGVFRNEKIYNFNGPIDLLKFKPINWIDKFRFGLSSLYLGKWADWRKKENIACVDWFKKWAGKSSTNALWKPMLDIKFGPFANKVPLSWMIGRLRQRMGSRSGQDEQLGYLKGSLNTLLEALIEKLQVMGVDCMANAKVNDLVFKDAKLEAVQFDAGTIAADNFLFTIPTTHYSKLLRKQMPEFATRLDQVEYFGALCVILEMNQALSDIYWLNVADPNFPFGGVIEHTNFIDPSEYGGKHIAYLSRYFAYSEPIANMSEAQIKELMLKELSRIYPKFNEQHLSKVHIFRTMTAATVCDLDFSEKVPKCQTPVPNMFLASMCHVYPDERSTNNSIRVAAEACRIMGIDTSVVPKNAALAGQIGF